MMLRDAAALSDREKEVLRLLLAGHDAKSIAGALGISVYTVNDRLRDARRKLGVSSSREAARRLAEVEGGPNFVGPEGLGGVGFASAMAKGGQLARPGFPDHRLAWLTGGMLIMSLVIAAAALSTMVGTSHDTGVASQGAPPAAVRPAETPASVAARKWVGLLDDGQWDESWRAAGTVFRAQLAPAQWAATIQPVRQPLGRASSRTLQSVVRTKTLPGAPAGDYQVLQFQTRFANKSNAVETVVLSREQAAWRVSGYFIR